MMKESMLVYNKRTININEIFNINSPFSIMAGPCAIESIEQMDAIAKSLVANKVNIIRGSAFKNGSSPYDLQGLGIEGLEILNYIKKEYNLLVVSEIMDVRDIELGIKYTDIIQIGSRNMHNYSFLKEIDGIYNRVKYNSKII